MRTVVLGATGLVGSALMRLLPEAIAPAREEFDLRDPCAVDALFEEICPELVFMASGLVGGIADNSTRPATFISDNLTMAHNVIDACATYETSRLCFLGSSCIYPRECPQPIREEYLMTGPLEPTNSAYAVAKIAGIEMCRAYHKQHGLEYVAVMPTNLYGPNDGYDLEKAHVLPAMIRRFHEARESGAPELLLWGSGTPRREFLHVDDLARACVLLMNRPETEALVNVGFGEDIPIWGLADRVREAVGYKGRILFDPNKPDGTPQKLLDSSKVRAMGWKPKISLLDGLKATYQDFLRETSQREKGMLR